MVKEKKLTRYQRLRMMKQVSGKAIKEIRDAKSMSELLDKHTKIGTCPKCNTEARIIKSVNKCTRCAVSGNKWERKFRKGAKLGMCINCHSEGLVDTKFNICFNCYLKRMYGGMI